MACPETIELKGSEIQNLYTLGSIYDNGYIIGIRTINDITLRMNIKEFLKLLHDVTFVGTKKRKHTWLEIKKGEDRERIVD